MEKMEQGFLGAVVCKAVGITYRQLDYWARTGLVSPSIQISSGIGSQRVYSFKDAALIRIVKKLLDTGVSLQQIRKAVKFLRQKGIEDFGKITLMSDGATVYECRSKDEIYDLVKGGQGVFGISLNTVCKEVEGKLKYLPTAIKNFEIVQGDKLNIFN